MQLTSCLGGTSSRLVSRRAVAPATVRVPAPKMLGPHIPKLPSARGMRAACRAQFSDEVMLGALVYWGAVVPYTLLSSITTSIKGELAVLKKDIAADSKAADDRWAVAEARWYALAQRVAALEVLATGKLPVTKAPGDG
ncbi:hypothetical protein CHLRE_11g467603v5 [Chlamydomonas reinhardtii]|uniref:Uncharacterized protein n=1 Tax=Chlamydomonas reinhardtii TaxID=3055 RepID=A0A2K3D7E6_CHLRE|nr:uncharacterized protein CHLRE_11g467603v5 [Chlamydomonas reinhardtii]PNW76455.1 hypothetical protein CHLRE_11g467603v5 [Chlamydomonas reinhardtii]